MIQLKIFWFKIVYYLFIFGSFSFGKNTKNPSNKVPVSVIVCAKNEAENAYRLIYNTYPEAYSVNVSAGGNTQVDIQDKISFEDIQKAVKEGWRVVVATSNSGRSEEIIKAGIEFVDLPLSRSGTNPFKELKLLYKLYKIYIKNIKFIKNA